MVVIRLVISSDVGESAPKAPYMATSGGGGSGGMWSGPIGAKLGLVVFFDKNCNCLDV